MQCATARHPARFEPQSRASAKAALNVYRTLRERGTQKDVIDTMQTRAELYDVLGYHDYERKLDELFAKERELDDG